MRRGLFLFLILACSGNPPAPSEPAPRASPVTPVTPVTPTVTPTGPAVASSLDFDAQRLLVLMEKLAKVTEFNTASCSDLANAWRAYGVEHKGEVETLLGRIKSAGTVQLEALRTKYGPPLEKLIHRQNDAAMPCSLDPLDQEVHAAAKALPSLE